jgi:non-canonical (house-cleaning) NTP pyrophosphatase
VITVSDLRDFWQRFQTGMAVAVAGTTPAPLLGVRDGFLRYLRDALGRSAPVAVVAQPVTMAPSGLPVSDEEALALARRRLAELDQRVGRDYDFLVAVEGGLHSVELEGRVRFFVRSWAAVSCPLGEACGGSGSIQLPERLIAGLDDPGGPRIVPGTRRSGGMISALTAGAEDRRGAAAEAVFHALATLFYGVLSARGGAAGL